MVDGVVGRFRAVTRHIRAGPIPSAPSEGARSLASIAWRASLSRLLGANLGISGRVLGIRVGRAAFPRGGGVIGAACVGSVVGAVGVRADGIG
jgi:hypothetical protein